MTEEFIAYRKFTDTESAEEICAQLKAAGIEYRLLDSSHSYVKIIGYTQIDPGVIINIQSSNFKEADRVLESYYSNEIDNIDKDYYLFQFSESELLEVVNHPYDWGLLDLNLAKKLLKEKGIAFSDEVIEERKQEKLKELTQVKEISTYKIVVGYLLSLIFPPVGMLTGLLIVNTRNILPDGQKWYIYKKTDRTHGQIMIFIGCVWTTILILRMVF